eukprot:g18473.t1
MERLVDYFLVVGAGDTLEPEDIQSAQQDWRTATYKTRILGRFPLEDYKECTFPPSLELFCFPDGMRLSKTSSLPRLHFFAATIGNGDRLFGCVLTFVEEVPEQVLNHLETSSHSHTISSSEQVLSHLDTSLHSHTTSSSPLSSGASHHSPPALKKTMSAAQFPASSPVAPPLVKSSSACIAKVPQARDKYFWSQCLVILSHHCFLDQYRAILTELYRLSLTPMPIPLERIICNFMLEVPLPPEGKTTVQYNIADKTIEFRRAAPNNPLEYSHFRLRLLFECLEVKKILLLMEAILSERRVLILSPQLSALTVVAETVVSLLFPFEWQHVYIPLLPQRLKDFLHAPLPYLIGMSSQGFPHDLKAQLVAQHEVVLVELNKSSVSCVDPPPRLPPRELRKLMKALEPMQQLYAAGKGQYASKLMDNMDLAFHYAPVPDEVELDDQHRAALEREAILKEYDLRSTFFRVFVSLFKRYQEFLLLPGPDDETLDLCFNVPEFLKERDTDSQKFLSKFMTTQAFSRFIEKCVHHELGEGEGQGDHRVLFFNESIIAKLNRSKFAKKRRTPFLDAVGYELKKTYVSPSPSTEGLFQRVYSAVSFPRLDASLFVQPRIKPPNFRENARRERPKTPPERRERALSLPVNIQRMMIAQRMMYTVWFHIFTAIVGAKLKQEMAKGFTGRTNFLLTAFRVLDSMEDQGTRPEAEVFTVLMKACAVVVAPEDAMLVLKRMKAAGYSPDGTLYNAVLLIFAEAGETAKGKEELKQLGETAKGKEELKQLGASNALDSMIPRRGSLKAKKEARLLEAWAYQRSNMEATHRAQVGMFENQFPGLTIHTTVNCPECHRPLKDLEIREGWTDSPDDYTTECPDCSERFVARFTVRPSSHVEELPLENVTQADANVKEVISEYLSPWVLKKEVSTLVERREAEYLTSKEFRRTSPALFWNLVWHLINQGLVIDFLLLEWLQSTQRTIHANIAGTPPKTKM